MMERVPEEVDGMQSLAGQGQAGRARGTPLLRQQRGKKASAGRTFCGWWGVCNR